MSSLPYVRTTIDTMERRDCATILACIGITCVLGEICSMVYSGQQTSTTIPDVDELVILHGNSYGANNVHLGWLSDSKLQEYKPLERIKLKSGWWRDTTMQQLLFAQLNSYGNQQQFFVTLSRLALSRLPNRILMILWRVPTTLQVSPSIELLCMLCEQ
jgi:hypothetical protein